VAGQPRKLITHSARNGFVYTMDRHNGQILGAKPYMDNINWTRGIDQKTGKPFDYDPGKDLQTYSGIANHTPNEPVRKVCPTILGGNNYWPSSYSPRTRLLYIPALTGCDDVKLDTEMHSKAKGWNYWLDGIGACRRRQRAVQRSPTRPVDNSLAALLTAPVTSRPERPETAQPAKTNPRMSHGAEPAVRPITRYPRRQGEFWLLV
jgi:hypothetical protein